MINDATIEDARLVGIPQRARVITTGDDSPGVIPERASDEFRAMMASADVVIAKGLEITRENFQAIVAEWEKGEDRDFLDLREN